MERSWNSSSTTTAQPSSSGSATSRAVSTPSVATSRRVRGEKRRSQRTCQPTSSPAVQPCSSAMRRARLRAATRRGCSTITRPSAAHSAGGTRVVLPAPGGATTTAAPRSRTAATMAGRCGSMGSGGANQRGGGAAKRDRACEGVTPNAWRKLAVKWLWLE